jgi:hypothetical protein
MYSIVFFSFSCILISSIGFYCKGKKGSFPMEEQQLQDFVHRIVENEALRKELVRDPERIVSREGFSPRLAQVVMRLVPHLTMEKPLGASFTWWWG